jgi:N-acetylmuramoyl-L-alanine amidase
MATIDSFLQKRKMRENHYGIIMVITAYILSMLMLVLGSDVLHDISSKAAGIETTGEETEKSDIKPALDYLKHTYKPYTLNAQLINPYSIKDSIMGTDIAANDIQPDNTLWLLGTEINDEQFDSLMMGMKEFIAQVRADKSKLAKNNKDVNKSEEAKNKSKEDKDIVYSVKVASYKKIISITKEDVKMLERITQAEASGEDMVGKILIVNVILNRVASDEFPDTIKRVIFQNDDGDYQFSPVKSGKYWDVKVSADTKKAVQKALEGEDYSKGSLYFMARKHANSQNAKWFDKNLDRLFSHGGHEFFK